MSFELDRSEVLSKRSQEPIFLRSKEEGRGRGRRRGEERQVEVEKSRKSAGRREAERVKEQECGIVRHFLCF